MNSPKTNYKSTLNNNHLHEGRNESCDNLPKVTSTPQPTVGIRRPSPFSGVSKSRLLGPRRYSLSDISFPINGNSKHDLSDLGAGPLLTSINYKDNISTYEETKSTGLAGRIVRYSEEAERRKPIVQEKYNGAGLFPIVHLFKNRSNSEEPPKRHFIKIGTPDRIKCLPPPKEISNKILEEITKPSPARLKSQLRQLDHRTENVLDALKEISRKRILAHEDYDHHQDQNKKIKTDELQRPRSSKRPQTNDELNQSLNTSMTQSSKKIRVYDEYAASRSSSDMSFKVNNTYNLHNNDRVKVTAKRKTTSTITEDPDRSKQVKLVTAETQTEPAINKDQIDTIENKKLPPKKPSPIRVFDAHPLENLRKNRLAALMGTLVGKEVVFQYQTEQSLTETQPKSILSTTRRQSDLLAEKHVHFDVPDTLISTPSESAVENLKENQSKLPENNFQSKFKAFPVESSVVTTKQAEVASTSTTTPTSAEPTLSFGSPKPTSAVIPTFTTFQSNSDSPTLSFSSSTPKVGGFKFNLGPASSSPLLNIEKKTETPSATVGTTSSSVVPSFGLSSTSTPSFHFGGPTGSTTSTAAAKSEQTLSGLNKPSSGVPNLGFLTTAGISTSGSNPVSASSTTAPSTLFGVTAAAAAFGTTTSTNSFGPATTNTFNVSKSTPVNTSDTRTGFGNATATATAPSLFSFDAATTTSAIENKQPMTTTFAFGSQLTTTTAASTTPSFGFGTSANSTPTITSSSPFDTSTNVLATKPSTFSFGPTAPAVSNIPATSTFNFGSKPNTTPNFCTANSAATFVTLTTNAPTFGAVSSTNTVPSFGSSVTTQSFGNPNPSVPAFGNTTSATPTFGSSSFSSTPATQPVFETSANVFGAKITTASTFGTPTTSTTSLFGGSAPNVAPFGNSTSTSNTQPLFGTTSTPTFGSKSETANVTSSSVFGGNKDATFTFGANKSGFVATPTPNFSLTAPSNNFGASTPAFGQTSNQPSTNNAFGQTSNQPSTNNAFGQTSNQPSTNNAFGGGGSTFGDKSTGSAFGASTSGFGTALNTPAANIPFGGGVSSSTGTFGSANSSTFGAQPVAQNKSFSFGSKSTTNQNNAPFAFGRANNNNSSTEAPKPSFSFTGSATSTPMFGSATSNQPNFGASSSSSAPTFSGGGSVPSFGTSFGGINPATAAASNPGGVGTFNIGAGANTGRSRPVAKAVRRRT